MSGVQAPPQDFSGQPMKLSWTVTNTGTGPTRPATWTDAVYVSPKPTLDAARPCSALSSPGRCWRRQRLHVQAKPSTLPVGVSGSFYFLVQTDVYGQVFQNGTTANNVGATTSAETVNLTPPPDLK